MADAGATALAIEAGRAVVFDREEMVARAEAAGIAVVAVPGPSAVTLALAAGLFAAAPYSPLEWASLIAQREYGL